MQRFYLPPNETRGELLTLSDREAHHALNVVRLRPGEVVMVLNGEGERLRCETVELARRAVRLRVIGREIVPSPTWPITLIQAMPKGKAFDTIVQKATELGTQRIVPLLSRRVISQVDADKHESKLEHWRAIALESMKQCGSPWMPAICAPLSLDACLASLPPAALRLVASLRSNALLPSDLLDAPFHEPLRRSPLRRPCGGEGGSDSRSSESEPGEVEQPAVQGPQPASQKLMETPDKSLPAVQESNARSMGAATSSSGVGPEPGPIQLWIGPEGDFTDEELDAIEAAGARPMTLGPLVLRADTAAIYSLAVVNCAVQRWSRRDSM